MTFFPDGQRSPLACSGRELAGQPARSSLRNCRGVPVCFRRRSPAKQARLPRSCDDSAQQRAPRPWMWIGSKRPRWPNNGPARPPARPAGSGAMVYGMSAERAGTAAATAEPPRGACGAQGSLEEACGVACGHGALPASHGRLPKRPPRKLYTGAARWRRPMDCTLFRGPGPGRSTGTPAPVRDSAKRATATPLPGRAHLVYSCPNRGLWGISAPWLVAEPVLPMPELQLLEGDVLVAVDVCCTEETPVRF